MTVSTTTSSVVNIGNGATTVFIAAGTTLTVNRIVPFTQSVSIGNQGAFYPQAVEQGLDLLELQIQQIETQAGSAIHAPVSDGPINMTLPTAIARANKFLLFDTNGLPISSVGVPSTTPIGAGSKLFFLSGYASLALADSAASSAGGTLIIDQNVTLGGNVTLNAKTILFSGGIITRGSQTLNIPGSIIAGNVPIFDSAGTGLVTLGKGLVSTAWFGAIGDASADDTNSIQQAINTAQVTASSVYLPSATNNYKVTSSLVISKSMRLFGDGINASGIKGIGFSTNQYVLKVDGTINPNLEMVEISNITFLSDNNSPDLIYLNKVSNSIFRDIGIRNCRHGIVLGNSRTFSNHFTRIIGIVAITGSNILFNNYTGGGHITFLSCSFGGAIGVNVDSGSTVQEMALVSCNFEGCSSNGFSSGGSTAGLSFVGCRSEKCLGASTISINPTSSPANFAYGTSITGCWFNTDVENLCIALGGAGGPVRGFLISGNWADKYVTSFVYLNGDGQSGTISGNRLLTCPAIVNTLRPGVFIYNNENNSGTLGPVVNPPLTTPTYTVTTPTTNRSIDVSTITLANLAQVVGTVIADLQTDGFYK
jgi:hypothetical protein